MKKVSVVILNWNGVEMLQKFLPKVVEYSKGKGVEVCVADNGSTDESVAWVQANCPDVRLIVLGKNYGFADGYNLALLQVEAEYVVLLNSDVEVTPHWLELLVAYMDAHPDLAPFNSTAAVTICSDFEARKNKVYHWFHFSP